MQEKSKVQLPGASKFCSWAIENGTSVGQWENEISLSSLVSLNENVSFQLKINDNFQSEATEQYFKTEDH